MVGEKNAKENLHTLANENTACTTMGRTRRDASRYVNRNLRPLEFD